jgi:hypothetical protein
LGGLLGTDLATLNLREQLMQLTGDAEAALAVSRLRPTQSQVRSDKRSDQVRNPFGIPD